MEFRYARHTQNIESVIDFYTSVLSFDILGRFNAHDGYDGVFLGFEGENWHLEFTQNSEKPQSKFDEDDALVFYPENQKDVDEILENLKTLKIPLIETKNPYWNNKAFCFEDCDHYKVIISTEKIQK
ncbi:Glyoxalase/Bleomycin resistance protein/Dioxygenase superfamily protein [Kaistella jeonii]|uniref:VOC domain-containing protein n=2 Tax=Kaistella jeonii TaxID=266749 RepID=A0A0C1FKV5_9FLAO|nr:VOC family protein [Kaistella jeonii]KIA88564.1 hypothetical protein OA86_11125 [Kaistella jeonii]SFC21101.1 Glyoxalase/Bleomycin resistance protein/Dioxygenase superfamily protein [Kaistella jeonii]VEI96960.1 Uncharacterised protein [Kaistella jeonii]